MAQAPTEEMKRANTKEAQALWNSSTDACQLDAMYLYNDEEQAVYRRMSLAAVTIIDADTALVKLNEVLQQQPAARALVGPLLAGRGEMLKVCTSATRDVCSCAVSSGYECNCVCRWCRSTVRECRLARASTPC